MHSSLTTTTTTLWNLWIHKQTLAQISSFARYTEVHVAYKILNELVSHKYTAAMLPMGVRSKVVYSSIIAPARLRPPYPGGGACIKLWSVLRELHDYSPAQHMSALGLCLQAENACNSITMYTIPFRKKGRQLCVHVPSWFVPCFSLPFCPVQGVEDAHSQSSVLTLV